MKKEAIRGEEKDGQQHRDERCRREPELDAVAQQDRMLELAVVAEVEAPDNDGDDEAQNDWDEQH